VGLQAAVEQETIGGERIRERRRIGVFGRQTIAEGEAAGTGRPPRLGDHVAMAGDGAGDIAAAMEEEDDAGGVGGGCRGPFGGDAVRRDRLDRDIRGGRVTGAKTVKPLTALGKGRGARAGGEKRTDGVDFGVGHRLGASRFRFGNAPSLPGGWQERVLGAGSFHQGTVRPR
jgi:hypothetical protein